jgi:hypothetical protein
MLKYQIPLRKKAIYLEAKSSQLKKYFSHLSIWVLFETYQPILEPFLRTLVRLMPSVDKILTSRNELLESLQLSFKRRLNSSSRNSFSSAFFSPNSEKAPFSNKHCAIHPQDSSAQNYCPYILRKNNDCRQVTHQPQVLPFTMKNSPLNNYSQNLKFIQRFEVFEI